ncbi:MAG: site-specific integrase [Alistipes sp.]|nr:site-specific integrase [Alistipes sp.]
MRNTFKVLFYVKRNAPLRTGELPVMGRITINGQRTQFATHLSVAPAAWSTGLGRVVGRSRAAARINDRLAEIRFRLETCYESLRSEVCAVTPRQVKERYLGISLRQEESLIAFFRRHNEEFARQVGISRSKTTYYKYRCVCSHLETFVRNRYGCSDLPFRELDRDFIAGFHAYTIRELAHKKNTTWVYMIALKHIFQLARGRGYLVRDLFADYKLSYEFVLRNYLSASEIIRLAELNLGDTTLRLVRDAFVFSCFTGLSYVDVRDLSLQNVQCDREKSWLSLTRRKTGSAVTVRLFAVPYAILLRYAPETRSARIFDLPSNGWCNVCLGRLAELAGIVKPVTFHTARHTFATTITLAQGMTIETISKLLGHRNVRTTQIYAAVTRSHLDGEMERLSRRIDTQYGRCLPEAVRRAE